MRFQIGLSFVLFAVSMALPYSRRPSDNHVSLEKRQSGTPNKSGPTGTSPTDPSVCITILKMIKDGKPQPGGDPKPSRRSVSEVESFLNRRAPPVNGGSTTPKPVADPSKSDPASGPDPCKQLAEMARATRPKNGPTTGASTSQKTN